LYIVIKYLVNKYVKITEIIKTIIKSTTDRVLLRLAETLNALYISVTIQIKINRDKTIRDTAMTASPADKLTGLPK